MKKGFEWSVSILMAIILAVVMAGIVWSALAGKTPPVTSAESNVQENGCNNANDCLNNQDGGQCLVIYPGDFTPFCGCLVKGDCLNRRNDFCGSDNKCA